MEHPRWLWGQPPVAKSTVPPSMALTPFSHLEVVGTSKVTFFLNETYERILKDAGFRKVEFLPPVISEEGLKLYGEEFFHSYLNPPKDIHHQSKQIMT
ncbi:hypothetical protein COOONC_09306, partial [Cooperia oncophora]